MEMTVVTATLKSEVGKRVPCLCGSSLVVYIGSTFTSAMVIPVSPSIVAIFAPLRRALWCGGSEMS